MTREEITKEIEVVDGLLDNFEEQLKGYEKDRAELEKRRAIDGSHPKFIEADKALNETYQDLTLSYKLVLKRKAELLKEYLKSE